MTKRVMFLEIVYDDLGNRWPDAANERRCEDAITDRVQQATKSIFDKDTLVSCRMIMSEIQS